MKILDEYKKYFEKITNNKSLLVILLIGVVLLAFSGIKQGNNKTENKSRTQSELINGAEYITDLEHRLAKILSSVSGASDVSVMITLSDNGQSVYARDEKSENKTSESGGLSSTSDGAYVLKNNQGGGQSAVLIKNKLPEISGVLITAKGAYKADVKNNIANSAKAVLNVNAHRVIVLSK
ncbi:MAG: hypothetical protein II978_04040 [Clostridia bacterium]|nr:hypothetical protein [Clostridia bacterium]